MEEMSLEVMGLLGVMEPRPAGQVVNCGIREVLEGRK